MWQENSQQSALVFESFARGLKRSLFRLLLALPLLTAAAPAQSGGGHTLFGDLKIDESQSEGAKPISLGVVLYNEGGVVVSRQTVSDNGRYRFLNLRNGFYEVAVEVDNNEIARVRVSVSSPYKTDFRQDLALEWRPGPASRKPDKPGTVSAADFYERTPANRSLFDKAGKALTKKEYERAAALLQQITAADPKDYQAWTELGTAQLALGRADEAERYYARALQERPSFLLAALNLGRLRLARKDYEGAIAILGRAVEAHPQSADANHFLGEAYLQIKKGSKAVGYLNEAIRLDPAGKTEVHLRLAALYNAAGLKDRAATEYEHFLAKRPDHPDKQKFLQYVKENKQP